jgi:hypothetical protein
VLHLQSVLKDVECTHSGAFGGKILSDHLLFAVDHHGLLFCVLLSSSEGMLTLAMFCCRLRKSVVDWHTFIASDHLTDRVLLLTVLHEGGDVLNHLLRVGLGQGVLLPQNAVIWLFGTRIKLTTPFRAPRTPGNKKAPRVPRMTPGTKKAPRTPV